MPRQGRRLGPPEVWNLALGSQAKAHAPKRFQPSRRPPRQQLLQLQLLLQDCRLLGLKPPKRFQPARRPPRQHLLQLLHAPAICLSGGSRLPFARPQIQGNNSYSYSYYFKTAVCSASNPPNASNPPAGLQGNNSYSYYMPLPSVFQGVQDCRLPALKPPKPSRRPPRHLPSVFQGVQDCRLPALKPPKPSRRPPRQQLLQLHALKPPKRFQPSRRPPRQQLLQLLHAPAICFSGGSRLPFARPQNPPYYFKTAVCSASNPPNASNPPAGLQGNNSYSYYMPLPSVFQGVQDCRLPALKSKATTLTATATTSRLPFARPQTPQTLPTRPQASKATTLTANTCPCHLSFRGFKTAVCPPSNPPNPPAGLQGTCHLFFQGVQDCRLPALKPPKPPKPSRRPPRQQLLQLHALKPPKRFQPSRRPPRQQLLQLLHARAICLSGGSRLPFARPQTPQTLPQASKATTLTATCPQTPQTLPTRPQASKATTLTATTCPCHLSFRGFKTAVCPPSNPRQQLLQLQLLLQDCRLLGLKPPKRFQPARRPPRQQLLQLLHAPAICLSGGSRLPFCSASNPPNASNPPAGLQGNNSYSYYMPLPSVFQGVQDCRLPASNPPNPPAGLQGTCHLFFQGVQDCRLPALKTPQTPQTLPQASKATTLTATCPQTPQTLPNPPAGLQGNNSYSYYMPLPSVFSGGSRLPFARPQTPPTTSRLPFARPQTPQTLPTRPQASKATTLTATTCPCHLSYRGFKTAVCPPSNPRQQLLQLQLLLQDCRLLGLKPPKRFQPARRPPRQQLLQLLHAPAICLSGGSRLPFARPQTPQTLPQASKAPAICFSGGSRLPFARPQTPQTPQTLPQASKATTLTATCPQTPQTLPTLPQASKATTLTATTCPCHLFFRGFKPAVCPPSNPPNPPNPPAGLQGNHSYSYMPSNPPNASNPPAGLQGNNSYSYYMPLPSVFSGGSRLPFARPQTPQTLPTLPQASKATTLTATTCPCHLFFQGVQDCRLPALKPPKPSRRPPRHLPSVFSGGSSLPFGRPQAPQTLPQASKATTLTATCPQTPQTLPTLPQASKATTLTATTCPCHLFFQGVQDCRLPGLKPPKRFQPSRRPPRQQLLQLLHAPAICLSGGSRLPFARPQTPQTLPQASKAPAICFSGGSSLPFARRQTPQTLPQASKARTLTATCPQTPQTLPTLPTAAWALHVSRALRYHACAFEATDASAADCGLSRQSLATFGTNKA